MRTAPSTVPSPDPAPIASHELSSSWSVAPLAIRIGTRTLLRLMGWLIAERVPVDLGPLFPPETALILTKDKDALAGEPIRVDFGGKPFQPPLPVAHTSITSPT